jgi:hypothetical protein
MMIIKSAKEDKFEIVVDKIIISWMTALHQVGVDNVEEGKSEQD